MRLRRLVVAIAAGVCVPAAAFGQTNVFRSAYLTPADSFASGIAVGDFDNDGAQDVATCNSSSGSNELIVLTGFNDGTLGESGSGIPLGTPPSGMVQGKFDSDSIDDLIVSEGNLDGVVFVQGLAPTCQGGPQHDMACMQDNQCTPASCRSPEFFADPGPLITTGPSPAGLAAADLNGDGSLDLVVADQPDNGPGAITILLGKKPPADGTFILQQQANPDPDPTKVATMPTVDSLPAGKGTSAVAIGNIDGGPGLDVLALNTNDNTISIFTSDGKGNFKPGGTLPTGSSPHDLGLVDLRGNGTLDLIVANSDDDAISVQLGNGQGGFGAAQSYPVGTEPTRLTFGDLNKDGHVDILASNARSADVSILLGDGTGTFKTARTFVADQEPRALALGDFNGDGLLEPAVASQGAQSASVATLINRGDGSLHAVEDLRVGSSPQSLAVADLDGDGEVDLLASVNTSQVVILPGLRNGFGEPIVLTIGGTILGVAAADLNGDARPDIVAVDRQNSRVAVLLSQGGGRFANPVFYNQNLAPLPNAVAVGDFNGDGRPDLAVTTTGTQPICKGGPNDGSNCTSNQDCAPEGICPTAPGKVSVLLQQADGTFGSAINQDVGDEPIAIATTDVNCDGKDDLLVANLASSTVSVLTSSIQDGILTLTLAQTLGSGGDPTLDVGLQPAALAVADFNGDGVADFAVADSSAPTGPILHLFQGSCTGSFTAISNSMLGSTTNLARALVARDFTGDGVVDLELVNPSANAAFLFSGVGDGKGTLRQAGSDNVSRMPVALAAADFDLDGRYDVATANSDPSANNLSILYNCARDLTANGAPANCNEYGNPGPTGSAALRGDGNGDGLRSAADLVAVGREVMDGDGVQVEAIDEKLHSDSYQASPGVDANGDGRVDAQDRLAVAHRIFGG